MIGDHPDDYKKLTCEICGKTVAFISSAANKSFCRYQFRRDMAAVTPWFCCAEHMIQHVKENEDKS